MRRGSRWLRCHARVSVAAISAARYSGSDNSGSGSDSSGSGSGHGSGDDNSGPGSGDDDDRDDDSGGKGRRDGVGKGDAVSRYLQALRTHGRVASAKANGASIDVRYIDGWRESINGNRYRLFDPNGRRVMERPAMRDDFRRLRAVAQ